MLHAPQGPPIPSPDGRFYAQLSPGSTPHLQIYARDGTLVADAGKMGWSVGLLGWAHDSSGVYFLTAIGGEAAGLMAPYTPIFKLAPATPEEARAQWWMLGTWTAGSVVVIMGIGYAIWWRRRMTTQVSQVSSS